MTNLRRIEAFTIPTGARVVAMSPTIAAKVHARAECDGTTECGVLALSVCDHIYGGWPNKKRVLNAKQLVEAAGKGGKGREKIGAFEWVDGGLVAIVQPMIARILDIMSIQRRVGKSWLDEFAIAVTLGTLSDYDRVVLQAHREIQAFYEGGPRTAAVMQAALGIGMAERPPEPVVAPYNRNRFQDFVEIGAAGPVLQPWEVPEYVRDMLSFGIPLTDKGRREYLLRYHPTWQPGDNIHEEDYILAYRTRNRESERKA